MPELLAIPCWDSPPRTLQDWMEGLEAAGLAPGSVRDSPSAWWIDAPTAGLRGYVIMQGQRVEAINFEILGDDLESTRARLANIAGALGWELHAEDDEDDEDS